jgi:hypothetical protein
MKYVKRLLCARHHQGLLFIFSLLTNCRTMKEMDAQRG